MHNKDITSAVLDLTNLQVGIAHFLIPDFSDRSFYSTIGLCVAGLPELITTNVQDHILATQTLFPVAHSVFLAMDNGQPHPALLLENPGSWTQLNIRTFEASAFCKKRIGFSHVTLPRTKKLVRGMVQSNAETGFLSDEFVAFLKKAKFCEIAVENEFGLLPHEAGFTSQEHLPTLSHLVH